MTTGIWILVEILFLSFASPAPLYTTGPAFPAWFGDDRPAERPAICTAQAGIQVDSANSSPSTWIIGKWKMVTVLEGNQDISPTLNPDNDRWIKFNANGTFESGGGPYGANTGTYRVDDQAKTLHIDSDAGEGDDSNWRIQFREDILYMRGIGSNRQEMTTVISQRVLE